jgi:spermidine synthase
MRGFYEPAEVVERVNGRGGELQLQRRGRDYEFIYSGSFLMSSYNGVTERDMVRQAIRVCSLAAGNKGPYLRVLIGGLGFGIGLQEALSSPLVKRVDVVEIEEAVVRWNRGPLAEINGNALSDPRVNVFVTDLVDFLVKPPDSGVNREGYYHAAILDTDNGPGWLSRPSNSFLYSGEGTALIKGLLKPEGAALSVWSESANDAYQALLKNYFNKVVEKKAYEKTGESSFYYLAYH